MNLPKHARSHPAAAALAFAAFLSSFSIPGARAADAFFFGDSLSDSGNLFTATGGTTPPPPYANGRFSNGPVYPELLAPGLALGTTAPAAVRANLNFAFGGATAAPGSQVPHLAQQIGMFLQRQIPVGPYQRFFILAGANDILNTIGDPATQTPAAVTATAQTAAAAVVAGVQTLSGAGARDLVILNVPNIAQTPRFVTGTGAPAAALASAGSRTYNTSLATGLRALTLPAGTRLVVADLEAILGSMITHAPRLGFSVTDREYLGTLASGQNPGDVGNYLFWDGIHPTTKTHALLAAAVTEISDPEGVLRTAAPRGAALLGLARTTLATTVEQMDAHRPGGTSHGVARSGATLQTSSWAAYGYGTRDFRDHGNAGALDHRSSSALLGAGATLDRITLGAAVSFDDLSTTGSAAAGFKMSGSGVTATAAWQGEPWFVDAAILRGWLSGRNGYRLTALGGLPAYSRGGGATHGEQLRLGVRLPSDQAEFASWIGYEHLQGTADPYTEYGAPGLNFSPGRQTANSSAAIAGLKATWRTEDFLHLSLGVSATARFEDTNRLRTVPGQLANTVATPAAIAVRDGYGQGFGIGLQAGVQPSANTNVVVAYDHEWIDAGSRADTGRFTASLGYRF